MKTKKFFKEAGQGVIWALILFALFAGFMALSSPAHAKEEDSHFFCTHAYIDFQRATLNCLSAIVVNVKAGKNLIDTPCGESIDQKERAMYTVCGRENKQFDVRSVKQ